MTRWHVRVTHIPTGIVLSTSSDGCRIPHSNRPAYVHHGIDLLMRRLRSRLYVHDADPVGRLTRERHIVRTYYDAESHPWCGTVREADGARIPWDKYSPEEMLEMSMQRRARWPT